MAPTLPLRIGIIGAGEVTQVIHLPTLLLLSHLFLVTAIADVSSSSLSHTAAKFGIPHAFRSAAELCACSDVDVVLIASADEFHAQQACMAARHGKHVFCEKPLALTREDFARVEQARKEHGVHVSVGYMRR
jgi:predicted dehydrogenase